MTKPPTDPKAARLAVALRANLAKRKAWERGRPPEDGMADNDSHAETGPAPSPGRPSDEDAKA